MVKLLYCGTMPGIVKGVGQVIVGKQYNVSEVLSISLLKTRSWRKVMKVIKEVKKKPIFIKNEE